LLIAEGNSVIDSKDGQNSIWVEDEKNFLSQGMTTKAVWDRPQSLRVNQEKGHTTGWESARQRWCQITRQSYDNRIHTNDRSKHRGADDIVTITTEELEKSGIEKDVIRIIVEVMKLVISALDVRLFAKYLWKAVELHEQFGHQGSIPNSN
jgi:hypothetical protein